MLTLEQLDDILDRLYKKKTQTDKDKEMIHYYEQTYLDIQDQADYEKE